MRCTAPTSASSRRTACCISARLFTAILRGGGRPRLSTRLGHRGHFHCGVIDGAFATGEDGQVQFHETGALTAEALGAVRSRVRRRVLRWFARAGHLTKAMRAYMASWDRGVGFCRNASVRIAGAHRTGLELCCCAMVPARLSRSAAGAQTILVVARAHHPSPKRTRHAAPRCGPGSRALASLGSPPSALCPSTCSTSPSAASPAHLCRCALCPRPLCLQSPLHRLRDELCLARLKTVTLTRRSSRHTAAVAPVVRQNFGVDKCLNCGVDESERRVPPISADRSASATRVSSSGRLLQLAGGESTHSTSACSSSRRSAGSRRRGLNPVRVRPATPP